MSVCLAARQASQGSRRQRKSRRDSSPTALPNAHLESASYCRTTCSSLKPLLGLNSPRSVSQATLSSRVGPSAAVASIAAAGATAPSAAAGVATATVTAGVLQRHPSLRLQHVGAAAGYTGPWRPNTQVHQLLSSRFQRLLLGSRQYLSQEVLRGVSDVSLDETRAQEFTGSYGKCRGTKKIPGASNRSRQASLESFPPGRC